ncbi:MAG: hypothetical protein LBF72_01750 [Holosporales bacterium]|nr:hypothetical protein [Holosporales bacterium]
MKGSAVFASDTGTSRQQGNDSQQALKGYLETNGAVLRAFADKIGFLGDYQDVFSWLAGEVIREKLFQRAVVLVTGKTSSMQPFMCGLPSESDLLAAFDIIKHNYDDITKVIRGEPCKVNSDVFAQTCISHSVPERYAPIIGEYTWLVTGGELFLRTYCQLTCSGREYKLAYKLCKSLVENGLFGQYLFDAYYRALDCIRDAERLAKYSKENGKFIYDDWAATHPGIAILVFLCNKLGDGGWLLDRLACLFQKPKTRFKGKFYCDDRDGGKLKYGRGGFNTGPEVETAYRGARCTETMVKQFTPSLFDELNVPG